MQKTERLQLLREIVTQKIVRKQEDFVAFLKERGVEITQATISRDLAELNLQKIADEHGKIYYALPELPPKTFHSFSQVLPMVQRISIHEKECMLHVFPGSALRVKQALLHSMEEEIFVCIADDDGVFVKTWSIEAAQALFQQWEEDFGGILSATRISN